MARPQSVLGRIRMRHGLLPVDLGAFIGLTEWSLRDIELSRRLPTAREKQRLSDLLGVSVEELFPGGGGCEKND